MDRDWTRILPDITDESHDAEERRETHYKLFGHYPPDDPQAKCEHPMHADIRRAMNGAQIDIPLFDCTHFDPVHPPRPQRIGSFRWAAKRG